MTGSSTCPGLVRRLALSRQLACYVVIGAMSAALQASTYLLVRPFGGLVGASCVALLVSTALNTEGQRRLTFAGTPVGAGRVHLQAGLTAVVVQVLGVTIVTVAPDLAPAGELLVLGAVGCMIGGLRFVVLRCWIFAAGHAAGPLSGWCGRRWCAGGGRESPIEYRIDRRSGVATYLQIVQQTKQALRLGVLRPGDRLPTARQVVEQAAINPNTVLKAYRELEREGLVEPRPGAGTFVRRSLGQVDGTDAAELRTELEAWMRRCRDLGLLVDDVDALYTAARTASFPAGPSPVAGAADAREGGAP